MPNPYAPTKVYDDDGNVIETINPPTAMTVMKMERARRLKESDWMSCSDRTMSDEEKAYRQALRDMPSTQNPQWDENGKISGVTWPTRPSSLDEHMGPSH